MATIKRKKKHIKLHKNIKSYTSKIICNNKITQPAKEGFCNIYDKESISLINNSYKSI